MKKIITLLTILLFVVFMVGCENTINPTQPITQNDNAGVGLAKQAVPSPPEINAAKGGKDKVEICHLKGNGEYVTISISENAYQAHLDHGDIRTMLSGEWEIKHVDYTIPAVFYYYFDDVPPNGWHPDFGNVVTITINTVSCDGPTIYFEMTFDTPGGVTYRVEYTGYYTGEGKMAGTRDVFENGVRVRDDGPWTAEIM